MSLIAVLPKHYRAIVLEVLTWFPDATVWVDNRRCDDLSEIGPLTQHGIGRLRNFEIQTRAFRFSGSMIIPVKCGSTVSSAISRSDWLIWDT